MDNTLPQSSEELKELQHRVFLMLCLLTGADDEDHEQTENEAITAEAIMQAVKEELGVAIGKDEPEEERPYNIQYRDSATEDLAQRSFANGRNQFRKELRNHFSIGEDV